MKPRNREVNIFNMSMLDVISGALGAILIVMVVLFPHYNKEGSPEEIAALKKRLEEAEKDAKKGRIRNPILIMAEWYSNRHDIDLFVDDGSKKAPKFDPRKKFKAYWPGDVRTEFTGGPGHELWLMRDTPPGEYKIYLNLYDRKGNASAGQVTPFVIFGSEIFAMPAMKLPQEKRAVQVGTLVMTTDRNLSFRGATPEIQERFLEMQRERNQKKP